MTDRTESRHLGEAAAVGPGWTLRVAAVVVEGAEALTTPTIFTEPPRAGYRPVVVALALTNRTGEAARASSVVGFTAAGPSGLAHRQFGGRCGVVPDEFPRLEVPPGGTVEGNVCFSVRAEDAGALVLYADPHLTYGGTARVHFALA